ncbi:mCG145730 [Mus musculus]|nr:mCG145730 [Mus musculus]
MMLYKRSVFWSATSLDEVDLRFPERKLMPMVECSYMLIKLPKDKENGNGKCRRLSSVSQDLNRAGPVLCVPAIRVITMAIMEIKEHHRKHLQYSRG